MSTEQRDKGEGGEGKKAAAKAALLPSPSDERGEISGIVGAAVIASLCAGCLLVELVLRKSERERLLRRLESLLSCFFCESGGFCCGCCGREEFKRRELRVG